MTWPTPESYTKFKNWEPIEDCPGCYREKPKDQQVRTPRTPEEEARFERIAAEFEAKMAPLIAKQRERWAEYDALKLQLKEFDDKRNLQQTPPGEVCPSDRLGDERVGFFRRLFRYLSRLGVRRRDL